MNYRMILPYSPNMMYPVRVLDSNHKEKYILSAFVPERASLLGILNNKYGIKKEEVKNNE